MRGGRIRRRGGCGGVRSVRRRREGDGGRRRGGGADVRGGQRRRGSEGVVWASRAVRVDCEEGKTHR